MTFLYELSFVLCIINNQDTFRIYLVYLSYILISVFGRESMDNKWMGSHVQLGRSYHCKRSFQQKF